MTNQRVDIQLSVVMTEDVDEQNALALNLLSHMARVASRFGVDLTAGAASAYIIPGEYVEGS
jgi:hypothetical protein